MSTIGNNRLRSYVDRMNRLREEIEALQADLKEVETEARVECGVNVKALRKWANAERKDKVQARIDELNDDAIYGEMLGHKVWNDSNRDQAPPSSDSKKPTPGEGIVTGLEDAIAGDVTIHEPDPFDARERGRQDFHAGIPHEDNPWPNTALGIAWSAGWRGEQGEDTTHDPETGEVIEEGSDGTEEQADTEDAGAQPATQEQAQDPAREDTGAKTEAVAVGEEEPAEEPAEADVDGGQPDGSGQSGDGGDDFPEMPAFLKRTG